MRSLKIYSVLFLVLILALNFTACKNGPTMPDNPPDNPPDNGIKFANQVPILYQRIEPYDKSNELPVQLNIFSFPLNSIPEWGNIQHAQMTKNSSKEFSYVAASLPYETKLWMYVEDPARNPGMAGAPQLNCRILKVMGTELTEKYIRKNPPEVRDWYGQDWDVTCFILLKDNTVVPWD